MLTRCMLVTVSLATGATLAASPEEIAYHNRANAETLVSGRLGVVIREFTPIIDDAAVPARLNEEQRRQMLAVFRLNVYVETRGELVFNKRLKMWKLALTDLRDVPKIIRDNELTVSQLSLSRTRTMVMSYDFEHMLSLRLGEVNSVLTILPLPENAMREPPYTFGLLPKWLIDADDLFVEPYANGLKLISRRASGGTTTAYVDPAVQYRTRRIEVRRSDGSITSEWSADDYREVDGAWLPFHTEERDWTSAHQLQHWRIIDLERAELNCDPQQADFSITVETGGTVVDLLGGARYKLGAPISVSLESALKVHRLIAPYSELDP